MTTKQKQRILNINVQINTPNEEIKPIKSEKLLGIYIQDDLKWSEYIQNHEKSLIKQLTSRLNALRMISGAANFKTRLMIANGIFSSKLIFQISLWGGTEDYLLKCSTNCAAQGCQVCFKKRFENSSQRTAQTVWLAEC